MKTYVPKQGDVQKQWRVIDAQGKVLGRVAAEAARLLRGKHKPQYTPYLDCGDYVIVINASKARITGNKAEDKLYYRHSGYQGHLHQITYAQMMAKDAARAMTLAIRGMLPHNRLGHKLLTHVRVYPGPDHRHEAQNPQVHEF